jgi:pyrimidine operon attenuation protein/uracil phosphoribosyltransferase
MPQTLILSNRQIEQKIQRIAYQIFENNYEQKEIILAGLNTRGFQFATRLSETLKKISKIKIQLIQVEIDKETFEVSISEKIRITEGSQVLIADDVLNSGKTLMYAVNHFLKFKLSKLSIAVLVNRGHHSFPVKADYVGLSLSTTLQEHISVKFNKTESAAYLS